MDVLRATFPAGTVSGAPKVRAMEIIDELEPSKRGIYAGAVGYLGFTGDMDLAIAIRTAVVKDGMLTCRPAPASWPIPCPTANGWKPRTRRAPCCAPRNSRRGLRRRGGRVRRYFADAAAGCGTAPRVAALLRRSGRNTASRPISGRNAHRPVDDARCWSRSASAPSAAAPMPRHAEGEAEEQAGDHADLARHQLLRIDHDRRESRGQDQADDHGQQRRSRTGST